GQSGSADPSGCLSPGRAPSRIAGLRRPVGHRPTPGASPVSAPVVHVASLSTVLSRQEFQSIPQNPCSLQPAARRIVAASCNVAAAWTFAQTFAAKSYALFADWLLGVISRHSFTSA